MRKLFPFLCGLSLVVYSLGFCAVAPVEAGIIDKMKDIYTLPDKMNELQSQYDEAARKLSEQQEQLQSMKQYSDRLAAQNSELLQQLEQMTEERAALRRNVFSAGIALVVLLAAYLLLIRLWRYAAWRKHKQHNSGTIGS